MGPLVGSRGPGLPVADLPPHIRHLPTVRQWTRCNSAGRHRCLAGSDDSNRSQSRGAVLDPTSSLAFSRDKDIDTLFSIISTTGPGHSHNGISTFLDPSTARRELSYMRVCC